MRNLFPLASLALPFLIPAAGNTLQAKNVTPAYAGLCCTRAQAQRCLPSISQTSRSFSYLHLLVELQKGKAQTVCPTKQGKKDAFKHINFKFVELSFPCEESKEDAFLLPMVSASQVPPSFFSPSVTPEVMLFPSAPICTSPALGPWLKGCFQAINLL